MPSTLTNAIAARLQAAPAAPPRAAILPPAPGEYHEYYGRYIALTPTGDFANMLRQQVERVLEAFGDLTLAQAEFSYAPGKWSVKQVLGHLADTERLFGFRATHIARGDASELPGIEQDDWMRGAAFGDRAYTDLLQEWLVVRAGTIALVEGLPAEAPLRTGKASGRTFTARALLHIAPGHVEYHLALHQQLYVGSPRWPR